MQTVLSDSTFKGTTIDAEEVRKYLFNMNPERLSKAMDKGEPDSVIDTANHTDFFEVRLRLYIAGFRKTLHQTFDEVRAFQRHNPVVAAGMIRLVIIQIRRDFIKKEWYELIPRLDRAAVKIEKLLNAR